MKTLAAQGRIVVPERRGSVWRMIPVGKQYWEWSIPPDFRVLRGKVEVPGPVTDYINIWEANHVNIVEAERRRRHKEQDKKREMEILKSRRDRIRKNTPHGAATSFFAPQL